MEGFELRILNPSTNSLNFFGYILLTMDFKSLALKSQLERKYTSSYSEVFLPQV